MVKNSSAWLAAAVTGLVAGCSAATPRPEVPGAPSEDPAGVPAPRAAQPATANDGGKMSCGAMKPKSTTPEPPQKMSCAGMKMDSNAGDRKPEPPKAN